MVTFTDKAVRAVRRFIKGSGSPNGGLRLAITGGGCSGYQYTLGIEPTAAPDDTVFECAPGLRVFVDAASLPLLEGSTVDFVDTLAHSGFTFTNPNAASCCGCGNSFTTAPE